MDYSALFTRRKRIHKAPNHALQRTGGTAGDVHVIDPVEHLWRFPRPPLSFVR
jgi:hypothetical protein